MHIDARDAAHTGLRHYFESVTARSFDKGAIVIDGDSLPTHLYYIESGFIKVYSVADDGSQDLYLIKEAGELIPMVALLSDEHIGLHYETLTPTVLRGVPKAVFESDLASDPMLCYAVLRHSLTVVRDAAVRIRNLGIADSRQRLIDRLLFLAARFGATADDGSTMILVPVLYEDLASALNMSRETANRIVRQLVQEGTVAKTRGRLRILDQERLQRESRGA